MYSKTGYIQPIETDFLNYDGNGGGSYQPVDPIVHVDPPILPIDPVIVPDDILVIDPIVPTERTGEMLSFDIVLTGGTFDAETRQPLSTHGVLVNLKTKEVYDQWIDTTFKVYNTDPDLISNADLAVEFSAEGYKTVIKTIPQIVVETNIYLHKASSKTSMVILLAIVAFIIFAKEKKKKVGKVTTADVFPWLIVAGGVLAFVLIKEILEMLGIWDSKDTKDLDHAATDPEAFWNPNFWKTKPANIPWSYSISDQTAQVWCQEIYDAFGAFNDDEETVISVFKRCRTKANASFICYVFDLVYKEDLLKWLRGGWWPQDRLSDEDVNEINQYINQLPNF